MKHIEKIKNTGGSASREQIEATLEPDRGEKLVREFEALGFKSKIVKLDGNPDFSEMIVLDRPVPAEKHVRIYRGVNYLCTSLLDQIPYAMRSECKEGTQWQRRDTPIRLTEVEEEVKNLAERPTYENLINYVEKVMPLLNLDEQRRMKETLKRVEDDVLIHGHSLRKSLIHMNYEHQGSFVPTSGITPYISASLDPKQAMGYGRGALMVIDLPLEAAEDNLNEEIAIRGRLNNDYITAILLRRADTFQLDNNTAGLETAIKKLNEFKPIPLYEEDELQEKRKEEAALKKAIDDDNKGGDIEAIKQKRVHYLLTACPEANFSTETIKTEAAEKGVDFYQLAQEKLYDFYEAEFNKIWEGKKQFRDRIYPTSYNQHGNFWREKINDDMILHMPKLIQSEKQMKAHLKEARREYKSRLKENSDQATIE